MSKDRTRRYRRAGLIFSSVGLIVGTALAVVPGASFADEPETVAEAEELVEGLMHDAAVINERVNDLRTKIDTIDGRLAKIDRDVDSQEERVDELRAQIGRFTAAEYRSGGVDMTVQLLAAADPEEFLAKLSSAEVVSGQQANLLRQLKSEEKRLAEQKASQAAELERQEGAERAAVKEGKAAQAKVDEAELVLERLTEEERQRLEEERRRAEEARARAEERSSRDGDRDDSPSDDDPPSDDPPPSSGRGAIALAYAEDQLGDPYVFGAAGPDAFDCSGLTMAAWGEAGVYLPHSSRSQYSSGTPVDRYDLQIGDLVIFYDDMHHVGIYAGDDQVIHAPRPGKSVEYSPIEYMPYAGAVRPG